MRQSEEHFKERADILSVILLLLLFDLCLSCILLQVAVTDKDTPGPSQCSQKVI